jgi:hypothetical protein
VHVSKRQQFGPFGGAAYEGVARLALDEGPTRNSVNVKMERITPSRLATSLANAFGTRFSRPAERFNQILQPWPTGDEFRQQLVHFDPQLIDLLLSESSDLAGNKPV